MPGVFNLDRSAKAIIAGAIAFATAISTGYDDGLLTTSEKWLALGAGITALAGVWAFSNEYAKAGIAAAIAGITAVAAATADDAVSAQEWTTIVLAVLVAFYAVWKVPNTNTPTTATAIPPRSTVK